MHANSRIRLPFFLGAALWATLGSSCGYRSVYGSDHALRLTVHVGQNLVPEPFIAQAAAAGARAELGAAGQLSADPQYPRLVIDVLRVDELSRGINVDHGQPHAGAMSLAVTVRARVFAGDNQDSTVDSGDLRRSVQVAGDADVRADSAARDVALRSAAERVGRAAARYALGLPEPANEEP